MAKAKKYTNIPQTTEVKISQMDNTDTFMIVNVEDKWRIGIAGRWVTKNIFNTQEEAQAYIDTKAWDLIMNAAAIMAEFMYKEMTNQNK